MIESKCRAVREALEIGRGGQASVAEHLSSCEACRRHAALLASFDTLEPRAADPERVEEVLAALPVAPWQRRRLSTWLPTAAGLGLAGAGLALVGGVPAPSAVAALPQVTGNLVAWIASWTLDVLAAVRGGSEAVRTVVAAEGGRVVLWLLLAAAGSGWAARALALRRVGARR
ncbi:MAG: hypothetical protein ACOY3Y_02720 [Acidobacteriota bacterium]